MFVYFFSLFRIRRKKANYTKITARSIENQTINPSPSNTQIQFYIEEIEHRRNELEKLQIVHCAPADAHTLLSHGPSLRGQPDTERARLHRPFVGLQPERRRSPTTRRHRAARCRGHAERGVRYRPLRTAAVSIGTHQRLHHAAGRCLLLGRVHANRLGEFSAGSELRSSAFVRTGDR